jgi:carboxyl-terminal processing protease
MFERRAPSSPDFITTLQEVMARVETNYVEPRSEAQLVDTAIAGVMGRLDPHSTFLDERALANLTELTTGHFGGIGVEPALEGDDIKIIAPIDDTPADRAGLVAGDVLERIDDAPVHGTSVSEASDALLVAHRERPSNSPSAATARTRYSSSKSHRAAINVASVRSRFLEPGYGYVRISQFQTDTGPDVVKALESLQGDHGPLQGLVLDLRNNPGGVLQASVEVADAFLTDADGLIVYTEGRQPSSDLRFVATGNDLVGGAPIVVLINKGSASAAEIVASALHHNVH